MAVSARTPARVPAARTAEGIPAPTPGPRPHSTPGATAGVVDRCAGVDRSGGSTASQSASCDPATGTCVTTPRADCTPCGVHPRALASGKLRRSTADRHGVRRVLDAHRELRAVHDDNVVADPHLETFPMTSHVEAHASSRTSSTASLRRT